MVAWCYDGGWHDNDLAKMVTPGRRGHQQPETSTSALTMNPTDSEDTGIFYEFADSLEILQANGRTQRTTNHFA